MNYNRHPRNIFFPTPPAASWSANNAVLSAYDASLLSVWRLEDTADSKGSNTLTTHGDITFDSGLHNNAAVFPSPLTPRKWFGNTSPTGLPTGTTDFTFAVWWYPTTIRDITCLFLYDQSSYFEIYGSTGALWFVSNVIGNFGVDAWPTLNAWNLCTLTRISGVFKFYLNDVLKGTNSSKTAAELPSCTKLSIGGNSTVDDQSVIGKLDEAYVWVGKGFTGDDVTALYNSGTGAFYVP
ncbi:MAG: LamG-like jellyroll fold domain-containing protein [Bacteroidales bacterium]|jgi:hypothetical protein